jgi:hypothetical protein
LCKDVAIIYEIIDELYGKNFRPGRPGIKADEHHDHETAGVMFSLLGGIFLGWTLGANDASNAFGSAVSARTVKFWTAAMLASVFVISGALF